MRFSQKHLVDIIFNMLFILVTLHPEVDSCLELQRLGIGNGTFAIKTSIGLNFTFCGPSRKYYSNSTAIIRSVSTSVKMQYLGFDNVLKP